MSKKPGYRHTPLGWIPDEWTFEKLESHLELLTDFEANGSFADVKANVTTFSEPNYAWYVRATDLENETPAEYVKYVDEKSYNFLRKSSLLGGELLVMKRGEIGKVYFFKSKTQFATLGPNLYLLKLKKDVDPYYVYSFFAAELGNKELRKLDASSTLGALYKDDVKGIKVPLPPYLEQRKIAMIFFMWDEGIAQTKQLIAQLQQRNKVLRKQLLTGKTRLRGFRRSWKEIYLAEAFFERNETGFVDLDLLSVGSLGVYPQSQSEKRDTSNSDKAKYKRICPGDIGYNTMRMWQGRSALSSLEGIVSPAYTILTPKERQHSEFYAYLFKLPSVVNKFYRHSQGLVEDTRNCKFKDFAIVKVEVPEYEEQVAIANVLSTAQAEIKSYEQKLNTLKQQKNGLMQKLLTGEVRVKI